MSATRRWLLLLAAAVAVAAALSLGAPLGQVTRGKAAAPMSTPAAHDAGAAHAEALALADARVQAAIAGHRSEVFWVRAVGGHYPAASAQCARADCRQVDIYNWDTDSAILAIVDVDAGQVTEVLIQPGMNPAISQRLYERAVELIRHDPQVISELGYQPPPDAVHPMEGGMAGQACQGAALCMAATFDTGASILWVVVDVRAEAVLHVVRAAVLPAHRQASAAAWEPASTLACPAPGSVERDGWRMDYETTARDGLRISDVSFNAQPVLTSAKLMEWHVDYGPGMGGFLDAAGCGPSSGWIPPYGETQVRDLLDGETVIGFEVVQDFRMSPWGANCRYRYQQHMQFFRDGRFRLVGGAFGRGCHTHGDYRAVMRIDLALNGAGSDSFSVWDGSGWQRQLEEGVWPQQAPLGADGAKWMVTDAGGTGYLVVPNQGQFGDGSRGDFADVFVTQHKPSEGDADTGFIGTCCTANQPGPQTYVNGESIDSQNLVLWYVPHMATTVPDVDDYYCWTVQGEPDPLTYPCFVGPMFVPLYVAYFPFVPYNVSDAGISSQP